jgi:DNA mismatch repair protein PMS2
LLCLTLAILLQRGTTVTFTNLFKPLPVRRKEFERNVKREFGKALGLLNAYALVPCVLGARTFHETSNGSNVAVNHERKGVRLTASNQTNDGSVVLAKSQYTEVSPDA